MPSSIIDSHVHLWPESMANGKGHRWMEQGLLAQEHSIAEYRQAIEHQDTSQVTGFVFVETDARHEYKPGEELVSWAKGPLDEIRYLRKLYEDETVQKSMKAVVIWAPMLQSPSVLEDWLELAEKTAGPALWKVVRGVRYLVQDIVDEARFRDAVMADFFVSNLKMLARRGLCFDVGVDQRSGGAWQLEVFAAVIDLVHESTAEDQRTVFVLNHLCKPDYTPAAYARWKAAIGSLAVSPRVYMKLSGAFSELPQELLCAPAAIAEHIQPWFRHVLACFGPDRLMFGSDWPVCNINAAGEDFWCKWKMVVDVLLDDAQLSTSARAAIWGASAARAYGIGPG